MKIFQMYPNDYSGDSFISSGGDGYLGNTGYDYRNYDQIALNSMNTRYMNDQRIKSMLLNPPEILVAYCYGTPKAQSYNGGLTWFPIDGTIPSMESGGCSAACSMFDLPGYECRHGGDGNMH